MATRRHDPDEIIRPPGWVDGTCYCGCGGLLTNGVPYLDRTHWSKPAPDGRLIKEFKTKFCPDCKTRKAHEEYNSHLRFVKMYGRYSERLQPYCKDCETKRRTSRKKSGTSMWSIHKDDPEWREKERKRQRELYHRQRSNPDWWSARLEQLKPLRREWMRAHKDHVRAYDRARNQAKQEARILRLQEEALDKRDPLCLKEKDPKLRELLALALEEFGTMDIFQEKVGRSYESYHRYLRKADSRYLSFQLVDLLLTRLEMPYLLDDLEFKRRSEWKKLSDA